MVDCESLAKASIVQKDGHVLLKVIVHPNSRVDDVRIEGDGVHIHVRERPHGGRANDAVIKLLKKAYRLRAEILRGHGSREKILLIKGISPEKLVHLLCSGGRGK